MPGQLRTPKSSSASSETSNPLTSPLPLSGLLGLPPNNAFLGAAVKRDKAGFLVTSPTMEMSLPGIFAAGDVRSGSTKQLGSAVGDGIAALLMTRRYLEAHHHKAQALIDA